MKREILIKNGSGWNDYRALREMKSLPRGTRTLMVENKVARIEVGPYHKYKPLGMAARFFDRHGEQLFCLSFDQNTSAERIKDRVNWLLVEGISQRIEANLARNAKGKHVQAAAQLAPATAPSPSPEPEPVASAPAIPARSARGPEWDAWFAANHAEWPAMRDAWKAEGLSSRARDERLAATVATWAAARVESGVAL